MWPTESETTYFLKDRTTFIRYYFDEAAKPFVDIHERINAGTSPFELYGDPEDGEPLYQAEWEGAEIAIALIGQTCVSLLADSLKLYLNTWRQREFRFAFDKHEDKLAAREGFVAAYRAAFSEIFGPRWSQCAARFDIIDQVVLARNRSQHGDSLLSMRARHDRKTLDKHPLPFFARPAEIQAWVPRDDLFGSYLAPPLRISRETLWAAIGEIEAWAEWLDANFEHAWSWPTLSVEDDPKPTA